MALVSVWRQRVLAAAGATVLVPLVLLIAAGLLASGGLGGLGSLAQVASGPETPDGVLDRPAGGALTKADVVGARRPARDLASTDAAQARGRAVTPRRPDTGPADRAAGTRPVPADVPVAQTAPIAPRQESSAPRRTDRPASGQATPRRVVTPPTSSRPVVTAPTPVSPGPIAEVPPAVRQGPVGQVVDETRGVVERLPAVGPTAGGLVDSLLGPRTGRP